MAEYARAMRQPTPPGMNFRPRYMPTMHNAPEHPGYYEEPRYPPPRMAYPRPTPEYPPGYNGGYQNPSYPPIRSPQSPALYQLDPGAMPYIPARYVPPPPGQLRGDWARSPPPPSMYPNANPNPNMNTGVYMGPNVPPNTRPGCIFNSY